MPDYEQMLKYLEQAEEATAKAVESMVPIGRITQVEAYVLGHLRPVQLCLEKAKDAVRQSAKAQAKKPKKEETDPENDPVI